MTTDFYRSQSVIFLNNSDIICETFGVSNKVVFFDKGDLSIKKEFDFSEFGFVDPRGLAVSPDERFLLVSGRNNNIYLLDLLSHRFISQIIYSINNFNSHLTLLNG